MSALEDLRTRYPETRLIRSLHGETVHKRGCKRAGSNWVPWLWAEGISDREWSRDCPWLKPCAYCLPELRESWGYAPEERP